MNSAGARGKSMAIRKLAVVVSFALVSPTASAALASPPAAAATRSIHARHAEATRTVWLCQPGHRPDPCTDKLTATSVAAGGARTTETAAPTSSSPFDCFYVYPTVSSEPGANANLVIQPIERGVARLQASPFSQLCEVWAPMYRQTTIQDLARGVSKIPQKATLVAYRSLLAAWKDFLAHDDGGRPIVFIGHSQGAALLIRLLHHEIDSTGEVRARTVLAILAGGNLQVPTGKTVGATFHHLPLCTKTGETGCVIAYSSFPSEPPPRAPFGRAGTGASIQSGEAPSAGQQVACVNPAALGGGTGDLQPWFLSALEPKLSPAPATPWVFFPGLYTARCEHTGDETWLQVDHATGTGRPVVGETAGPTWGYHTNDVNLALGNLLADVSAAEAHYLAKT